MRLYAIIFALLSTPSYAGGTLANVSATVGQSVTLSQNEDGTLNIPDGVYCDQLENTVMCYF